MCDGSNTVFEEILTEIERHDTIIIHRHHHPDGDALGSQIGLKHLILANFPGKRVFVVGDEAGRYAFMAGSVMDQADDSLYPDALAFILDTSARSLISDERYMQAHRTVRIDHHLFVEKIADVEIADSSYESCCGLVTQMAVELGWTIPPEAAAALYTGMVTDSGRFRYDATSARTFRLAARLMEQPIDTEKLYHDLYSVELRELRLKATFIGKIELTPHNVAYIRTEKEELVQLGCDSFTASRGMVGLMSDVRGIDIWVTFTETDRGILCELRSGPYNINPVAVKYGGGGHAKASGATLKSWDEAERMLADLDEMAGSKG